MARNRKRAKQRRDPRARRAQAPAGARSAERPAGLESELPHDAPDPLEHGSAEVDLAEAQLAVGRPELTEAEAEAEATASDDPGGGAGENELEEPAVQAGGGGGRRGRGAVEGADGDGAGVPARRPAVEGNRVTNFVRGSWRELQRVQWPDRRQVMQATGIVLVFVIVAGSYLGLMDAIFSRLVDAIL